MKVELQHKDQVTANSTSKAKRGTKKGVTEYSRLGTEKERINYLGFRDDIMTRQIVGRKFNYG